MTTFVLIHGAYQGGWIWKLVATRLRYDGHLVYAPTLDGCGKRIAQVNINDPWYYYRQLMNVRSESALASYSLKMHYCPI